MHTLKTPPVVDFKLVLISQLKSKIKELLTSPLDQSTRYLENVLAEELSTSLSNQDIIKLLENRNDLRNSILNLKADGNTKQKLGAELFERVSHYDSALCAKVTGMLLDLDIFTICHLLNDSEALETAVLKAKNEYMNYKQRHCKDFIGEEIYKRVYIKHSDSELAAQLTGMLLELDISSLQSLLDNPEQLDARLNIALRAIEANRS